MTMDRREINRWLRNQQDLIGRGMRRATNAAGFIDENGDLQLDGFNRPLPSGTFRWAVPWGPGDQVVVAFLGDTAMIIANLSTGGPGDTGGAPPGPPPDEDDDESDDGGTNRDYARTTVRDCGPDPNEADLYATNRDADDVLRLIDPFSISLQGYAPTDLQTIDAAYAMAGQPNQLRAVARGQAEAMLAACAAATGVVAKNRSAYRSCDTQIVVFNGYVDDIGLEEADRQSARPGHSEHQLGLTMDLTSASVGDELDQAFGTTAEGIWLRDHCHDYGFVMSYPSVAAEERTGYMWEPWHFRYVGTAVAAAYGDVHQTKYLNEYLRSIDAGAGGPGMVNASTGVGVQTRWTPIEDLLAERGYVPGGAGVTSVSDKWDYVTSTVMADPGAGNMRANNAAAASATALAFSATNKGGTNVRNVLLRMAPGDLVTVQEETDSTNWARFELTGAVTDNTSWVLMPVVAVAGASSGTVTNNTTLAVVFSAASDGGGGGAGHDQVHALSGADHTGAIAAAQHPSIASGNLHPEYASDADLTAHAGTSHGVTSHGALTGVTADQHHAQAHILAGADHSASGLTVGHVLRASGAAAFGWAQLQHADLGGVSSGQHHAQAHALSGADHTGTLAHSALSGIGANDHHAEVHALAGHTVSGLTAGQVLTALSATTFGWQTPATGVTDHGLLSGLADDDHPQYATDAALTTHAGTSHGVTDHGALSGLTDDDHGQYVLAAGDTMTGALNLNAGGEGLRLGGATSNRIGFGVTGAAAPSFTTYSAGVKIVLWDSISASSAGYALGIEGNTLWLGVPTTAQQFKFYGGTTLAATLSGAGALTLVGALSATDLAASGDITVSSAGPKVAYVQTGGAADNRRWDFLVAAEAFRGRAVNDADSVAANWVAVERTGTTIDSVTFPVATVSGALTLHGAASSSPTTWTPAWTNVTIGNAAVTARYERIGKRVFGHLHVQFGSTSAFAGGSFAVSTPVTGQAVGIRIGAGIAYDQSANAVWTFTAFLATTGTMSFQFTGTGGAYNLAAGAPFTWAQLDQLSCEFQYEAA